MGRPGTTQYRLNGAISGHGLSEAVLTRLLGNPDLVARLEQMEDFRNLRQDASKIIAQSQKIRDGKKPSKSSKEPEDPEVTAARKARREQMHTLRSKLLKFVPVAPVFMYLTDYSEQPKRTIGLWETTTTAPAN